MTEVKPVLSHNQPYYYPGEKTKSPEVNNSFQGKEWGQVNSAVGGRTANYEEFAFGLGIIRNYFNSFF